MEGNDFADIICGMNNSSGAAILCKAAVDKVDLNMFK
jgi:hypothetical protein